MKWRHGCPAVLLFLAASGLVAQTPKTEEAWLSLMNGSDLSGWHPKERKDDGWFTAGDVRWNAGILPTRLEAAGAAGGVFVNGRTGRSADLISDATFGDIELYLEFFTPAKSNSGVYLHGLYEVQILDLDRPTEGNVHDCGAIYQRWIDGKGVGGRAPLRKACKPAGQWQSFHIFFRAPRFSSDGRKIANAKFLRVLHNGVLIHENVEVDGPTRAALDIPEAERNPLMLQGDHGPVAFRRIRVRSLAGQ